MIRSLATLLQRPAAVAESPGTVEMQRAYAKELLKDHPVASVTQGIAEIVNGLVGGRIARRANEGDAAGDAAASADTANMIRFLQGGGDAAPAAPVAPQPDQMHWGRPSTPAPVAPVAAAASVGIPPDKLAAYMNNPRVPEGMKSAVFSAALPKPAEHSAKYKEYQDAVGAGYDGTFTDYMGKYGSGITIQNDLGETADTAEAKARGPALVQYFGNIAADLPAADALNTSVDRISQLLEDVTPGADAGLVNFLQKNLGIEVGDNAGKLQAVSAMIDYLTPRMRVPGSGATSDMEMNAFKNSLPSLLGTPEGNQTISDTLRGLATRRLEMAKVAQDYLVGTLDAKTAVAKMAALPNPFKASKGAPVQIKDDAEYDALPSGTDFIDPEGKPRRKP